MASISHSLDLSTLSIKCNDGNPGTNHPSQESCLKASISSTTSKAPVLDFPNRILKEYLCKNEDVFHDLDEVREKGWNDEESEKFFQKLQESADHPTDESTRKFYNMSKNIAKDLHESTGAFTVGRPGGTGAKALHLCLAPGGYTSHFLDKFPNAVVSGITLSEEDGGHEMVLKHGEGNPKVQVQFMDITMLAEEFGTPMDKIPAHHPEAVKFTAERPFLGELFDLVVCDGQILRIHRHNRDRSRERTRLLVAQLILGLSRIKQNGTLIILLHKVDAWDNLLLLKAFDSFSKIRLFKPRCAHTMRSSFYLIAKKVDSRSEMAIAAVRKWKEDWWRATFAGEAGTGLEPEEPTELEVMNVLEQYGERWRQLGKPIWALQLDAMVKGKGD